MTCNFDIFKHVRYQAQKQDNTLQKVQSSFIKDLKAITMAFDDMTSETISEMREQMEDGISRVAHASYDLDLDIFRRSCFQVVIKEEFISLF